MRARSSRKGCVAEVFAHPLHPYTAALIASAPSEGGPRAATEFPAPCRNRMRCRRAAASRRAARMRLDACEQAPPPFVDAASRDAAPAASAGPSYDAQPSPPISDVPGTPLVEARGLTCHFAPSGLFSGAAPRSRPSPSSTSDFRAAKPSAWSARAVRARARSGVCCWRCSKPTAGQVLFEGADLARLDKAAQRRLRRRMQLVFQDPYSSLDPRRRVGDQIADGLDIHDIVPALGAGKSRHCLARSGRLAGEPCRSFPARILRRPAAAHRNRARARDRSRISWWPTSRCRRSTFRSRRRCWRCLPICARGSGSRCCSSATICRRCGISATAWSSCISAASWRKVRPRPCSPLRAIPIRPLSSRRRRASTRTPPHRAFCCAASRRARSTPPSGCVFRTRCPYALPACAEAVPALAAVRQPRSIQGLHPRRHRGRSGGVSAAPRSMKK